ncbi:MAG TPA: isoprenyl transferase [Desulfatiglandales bacterium]|nr:isoprenyl transferase [Desulfatiglandales bacterium]
MPDINPDRIPRHVAIIMDGNGRWAKKKGFSRVRGHEEGTEAVRVVVRESRDIGIKWLTLYAFSEENWKRPRYEIDTLMGILKRFLKSELNEMLENGIRFQTIGNTEKLPKDVRRIIQDNIEKTSGNSDMVLTLALSYGGRQEISLSVRKIAEKIRSGALHIEEITEDLISKFLYTEGMPDPDLLIRTSGEYRVSNFLLWQIAYTEIYITPVLWPDFRKEEYLMAIEEFQKRERRFGSAGE